MVEKSRKCFVDVSPEELGIKRNHKKPDMPRAKELAKILKVISVPHRLSILRLIFGNPLPVCLISEALGVEQTLVSHHLAVLRREKLVKVKSRGKYRLYLANEEKIYSIIDSVLKYLMGEP